MSAIVSMLLVTLAWECMWWSIQRTCREERRLFLVAQWECDKAVARGRRSRRLL